MVPATKGGNHGVVRCSFLSRSDRVPDSGTPPKKTFRVGRDEYGKHIRVVEPVGEFDTAKPDYRGWQRQKPRRCSWAGVALPIWGVAHRSNCGGGERAAGHCAVPARIKLGKGGQARRGRRSHRARQIGRGAPEAVPPAFHGLRIPGAAGAVDHWHAR